MKNMSSDVGTWVYKKTARRHWSVLPRPWLEINLNNRDSVRKACEAHLIDGAMIREPRGIIRRDELN